MTTQAIGPIESMDSESFINRMVARKNTSKHIIICPDLLVENGVIVPERVQIAELKSSLLVNNIFNNIETNDFLNEWVTAILRKILREDYEETLRLYSELIPTSSQKDAVDNYPVAQLKKFSEDPEYIQSDFMAQYDFLKFIWIQLGQLTTNFLRSVNCKINYVEAASIIFAVQQTAANGIVSAARGVRTDDPQLLRTTDQVGITNIYNDELTRWIDDDPSEPWQHPGRTQCFLPDRGAYGAFLKNNRDQNTMYSSVQCGISGSINFGIFMYLNALAIGRVKTLSDPLTDAKALITAVTTVLVGDGGHNVRETITGLTLVSIALKTMLDDLKAELTTLNNGNQVNLINDGNRIINIPAGPCSQLLMNKVSVFHEKILPSECQGEISQLFLFKNLVTAFGYWEDFIVKFHQILDGINPLNVFTTDLNTSYPEVLKDVPQAFANAKAVMYNIFAGNIHPYGSDALLATQIFTALDNNRYALNRTSAFETVPTVAFETVVNGLPGGPEVIQKTADKLSTIITECNEKYGPNPDGNPVINVPIPAIPLAFKGTVNRGPLMARNSKEYEELSKFYGEDNVVLVEN
jgi:hypothetical protein